MSMHTQLTDAQTHKQNLTHEKYLMYVVGAQSYFSEGELQSMRSSPGKEPCPHQLIQQGLLLGFKVQAIFRDSTNITSSINLSLGKLGKQIYFQNTGCAKEEVKSGPCRLWNNTIPQLRVS